MNGSCCMGFCLFCFRPPIHDETSLSIYILIFRYNRFSLFLFWRLGSWERDTTIADPIETTDLNLISTLNLHVQNPLSLPQQPCYSTLGLPNHSLDPDSKNHKVILSQGSVTFFRRYMYPAPCLRKRNLCGYAASRSVVDGGREDVSS